MLAMPTHGTIAVTDYGWYQYLVGRSPPEVNFWTPSDRRPFRAPEFSPFFFKLKSPLNAICGFGYFARWSSLPDWLAWECFGEGNGCESLDEMRARISAIRARIRYVQSGTVSNIGCILMVQPTFFPESEWVRQPADWPVRTVDRKGYDLTVGEGKRVLDECLERAAGLRPMTAPALPQVAGPAARYGAPLTITPRLGQGTFRVAVTDAYGRACAVTSEHSLPALEAAHLWSYSKGGPHEVRNGLLLRADMHRLFDKGYVTVTPQLRLEVSARLRTDFDNGRSYYPFHGQEVRVPTHQDHRPAIDFVRWHNDHVFLG